MSLELGLWLDFGTTRRTLEQQLERFLPLVRLAEAHGFTSVWAGESYALQTPSPLLTLAALAPQTRLKLGSGVLLLPSWHPLRLAYETAALDQLSGGRLILGVGAGQRVLPRRFGVQTDSIGGYLDEMLAALRVLWSGGTSFDGRHLKVEGGIGPLPVQPGGPPIWVGGAIRRSAERAAEFGDCFYASTTHVFEHVLRQIQRYRAALVRCGKDPDQGAVAVNRLAVVAESAAEARDVARVFLGKTLQVYARMGSLGEDRRLAAASPEALYDELERDICLVGTPDEVTEQIQRYVDAGVSHVDVRVTPQEMPVEVAARTIQLLGERVLPRFG